MTSEIKDLAELRPPVRDFASLRKAIEEWRRRTRNVGFATSEELRAYECGLNDALLEIDSLSAGLREDNLTDEEMLTLERILYKRVDCDIILNKLRELRRVVGEEK